MSLRNWLDPNWRHKLTNALIIGSVVASFGVIGTAANSYMTKASPALYVFLGGGAFIGLLLGGVLYLIVNKGSPTSEVLSASASPSPASPSVTATPAASQQLTDLIDEVRRLRSDMAESPNLDPTKRLSILKDEHERLSKRRQELSQQEKESFDNQELTLESLEEGKQRHLKAIEAEKRQQELATQESQIQRQQAAQRDEELEKRFANRYAPIVDYAIVTLHKELSKIAKEPSEQISTDFSEGDRPSVHNSTILKDGKFQKGKHRISVGSHKEWEISIISPGANTDEPIARRSFDFRISAGRRNPDARSTDWYSLLTVSSAATPVTTEPVELKVLCIARHGAYSHTDLYSESCNESEYQKPIQGAIRALIQDRYNACPLGKGASPTPPSSTPSKGASPPSATSTDGI